MNAAIPEQWLPPPAPRIGERERLGATFVLSLLVHGMLILGLGFALEDAAPVLPTLDVMLTQTQTPLTPKQADFLAQANNQGGGEQKIEHDIAMARLAAEIHLRSQRYAKRPSRKFVSASTREYAWAAYLRAWVDRVERVGNLNYPEEARRRHLGGVVVINVGIRRDGSVERADIVQSSNIPLLDAAALRIARLAEPYAPLPKTEEDPDILNVVRTWQFMPGGELIDR